MLNKSHIFGVLAAVIAIAPGAAFAGQQNNDQNIYQSGAAVGSGNTVVNQANQQAVQNALNINKGGHHYGSGGYQGQRSGQNIGQSGAAIGEGNTVVNTATQRARQNATELNRGHRYHY
ncbi:MAG: filamentous hemagglutinin [Cyanomargarita calcarea GSE-NOS-MK-12-04C]|jgi:hypothetical protein|uniref:Filamentous hemagglutinin n=1 Tax=Cyanomargarita calcarea GSE-NOS-MK-12-04C TaxID=2839659 RepID=A0A951QRW5_9CYAN|nr:filamentous hemagglutinin [Cyanomargarita calcarea GSE-NOS-MK-12-04C]